MVTGATGFIGNRLIEVLTSEPDCTIIAIVRNFGNAIRLARSRVKIIHADILDKASCRQAFQNADYVFHCAYGNKGAEEMRDKVNAQGTLNILELALEARVSGFLFLSTLAVYGFHQTGIVTEDTPFSSTSDSYANSKRQAEEIVLRFGKQHSLPVVVLQPSGVYGPWAQSYGLKMMKMLQRGRIPLTVGSNGIANLVYVDDLIQAMLKAIVNKTANGQAYLINGPDYVSWEEYFTSFGTVSGRPAFVKMTADEIRTHYKKSLRKESVFSILPRLVMLNTGQAKKLTQYPFIKKLIPVLKKILPRSAYQRPSISPLPSQEHANHRPPIIPISEEVRDFYDATSKVSSTKATRDFGYKANFTFKKGFALQAQWYDWFTGKR